MTRAELRAAFTGRPPPPSPTETPVDVKFRTVEGSCAVDTEGRLWCWGPLTKSRTPRLVEGVSGATSPIAMRDEACALVAPKRIRCATGTSFSPPEYTPPFEGVLAAHSRCALVEGGKIHCWGQGPDVTVPADVVSFTHAPCKSDVGHILLHASGRVTTTPCGPDVSSLRDIVQVSGSAQACGVTRSGRVACTARTEPDLGVKPLLPGVAGEIPGIEGAVEVAVAPQYACARLANGRVKCFGDLRDPRSEEDAPLFAGVPAKAAAPPTDIGLADVSDITIDDDTQSFCAVSRGTITCNGVSSIGAYVPIDGLPPMIDVACGSDSCCAIDAGDALWCWGSVGLSRPALPARRGVEAVALTSFWHDAIALSQSGDLHRFRQGKLMLIGPAAWPNPPADVRLIAGGPNGSDAVCAHVPDGEARCWWREGGMLDHSIRLEIGRPIVVTGPLRDVTVDPECGISAEAWCRRDGKRMPASAWEWKEKAPAVITDLQSSFRAMHTELGVIGDGRHYNCYFDATRPSAPPSCQSYVDHRVPAGATAIWNQHSVEGYLARDGSITTFTHIARESPPPPKRVLRTSLVRSGSGGDAVIDDAGRVWVWPAAGAGRGLVGTWGATGRWTELRPVR